jgi:hypothetical protein
MTTHADRAAKMYGTKSPAAPRAPAPAVKSLYAGKRGDLDAPISRYYDRRESSLRNDAEGLRKAREERKQLEAFALKRGIAVNDLDAALTALHDHDVLPRSQAAIETRRVRTKEALRLEHGGYEQSQTFLKRYVSVTDELAKEVPTLAARANATGAAEDPRIINALAHYGETKES